MNEVATIMTGITSATSVLPIIKHFAPSQPDYIRDRLERSLELAREYLHEKLTGSNDTLRSDWFPEGQKSDLRPLSRLLEKTVRNIINDSEERKSKYIAYFWANICLTSNSDIDEATAFSYLNKIESLSWRQLCLIRFLILRENKEVDADRLDEEKSLEQMSQNDRTRFHAISREYNQLVRDDYFRSTSTLFDDESEAPCNFSLGMPVVIDLAKHVHSLMNLDKIPMKDIVETFSLWNVRPSSQDPTIDTQQ